MTGGHEIIGVVLFITAVGGQVVIVPICIGVAFGFIAPHHHARAVTSGVPFT